MITQEELIRDYHYKRATLEEQEDDLKRGERTVNSIIEQTTTEINAMLRNTNEDNLEAQQFARYRLAQLSQEMTDTFLFEKRQIHKKLEESEMEFHRGFRNL